MSRSRKVPAYCRHKASHRAVVRIHGQDVYLGPYGSTESHDQYQLVIAEWRAEAAGWTDFQVRDHVAKLVDLT